MSEKKEKFACLGRKASVAFRRIVILKNFLSSGAKVFVLNPYWKDNMVIIIFALSILVNFFLWLFLFKNQKNTDYPIILHYNLFGVDYLGNYAKVYIIPFVGIIVIFANTILGYYLYAKEKLASYFLSFNILIVQMFLLLAGYLIVRVNS